MLLLRREAKKGIRGGGITWVLFIPSLCQTQGSRSKKYQSTGASPPNGFWNSVIAGVCHRSPRATIKSKGCPDRCLCQACLLASTSVNNRLQNDLWKCVHYCCMQWYHRPTRVTYNSIFLGEVNKEIKQWDHTISTSR